jgi:hypothetical protein
MKRHTCGLVHVFFGGDCGPTKLERDTAMADLHRLFTLEELKDLDLRDLEILKTAITYVLRTDDEIRVILERRVRDVYNRLKQPPSPQAPPPP